MAIAFNPPYLPPRRPKVAQMDAGELLSSIGHAGRLFIEAIPDVFWLSYYWAKDWQGLLGGLLLLLAARIFSLGSVRAARIRATAMIRAAQIAAGAAQNPEIRPAAKVTAPRAEPPRPPVSAESELIQKVEQLRSLIRSAMSTLTVDTGRANASPNFFCERIALLRFDENTIPPNAAPVAREPYKKLLAQLAAVRQATEHKAAHAELSQALVQLNARAREFAAVLAPVSRPANIQPVRKSSNARA